MDKEGVVPIAHRNDVTGRAALDQASLTAALQSCEIMEDGEVLGGGFLTLMPSVQSRLCLSVSVCPCLSVRQDSFSSFFF